MSGLDLGSLPEGQDTGEGKKAKPWLIYVVGALCSILTFFIEGYEKDREARPCSELNAKLLNRIATLTDNEIQYLQKEVQSNYKILELEQQLKEKSKNDKVH